MVLEVFIHSFISSTDSSRIADTYLHARGRERGKGRREGGGGGKGA